MASNKEKKQNDASFQETFTLDPALELQLLRICNRALTPPSHGTKRSIK